MCQKLNVVSCTIDRQSTQWIFTLLARRSISLNLYPSFYLCACVCMYIPPRPSLRHQKYVRIYFVTFAPKIFDIELFRSQPIGVAVVRVEEGCAVAAKFESNIFRRLPLHLWPPFKLHISAYILNTKLCVCACACVYFTSYQCCITPRYVILRITIKVLL